MDETSLKPQKRVYPFLLGMLIFYLLLLLSVPKSADPGPLRSRDPARADFDLKIEPKPAPGGHSTATLTVIPRGNYRGRIVACCVGNEIVGGKKVKEDEKSPNYVWRKDLLSNGIFRKEHKQTYHFRLHYTNLSDFWVWVEPWEHSRRTGWVKKETSCITNWMYFEEKGGIFVTPNEAVALGLRKGIRDTLNWELSNVFLGKLDSLLALFTKDEPSLSRTEALNLVDKAYNMVLQRMKDKNSPYINPSKPEALDIPVTRAIQAIQEEATKEAKTKGSSKLETYREMARQWKEERARIKAGKG